MSDALTGTLPWLLAAVLGGTALGIFIARFSRTSGVRSVDDDHRIRGLEAELRVSQRRGEEAREELATLTRTMAAGTDELTTLRDSVVAQGERLRQLKTELQRECAKTATLRQELAERATEMTRTFVSLRDAQTELSVNRVGSDVILEQIARLERDRADLAAVVEGLRQEMMERSGLLAPDMDSAFRNERLGG
jgi:chromosome segregation ATPase